MFPKFIKASNYARVERETYIQGSTTRERNVAGSSTHQEFYVKLESIIDVQRGEKDGVPILVAHVVENSNTSCFVTIIYQDQIDIVMRYLTTAHVDSNHDIIAAISDIKEFMCHLTTLGDQEKSKKRKKQ